MVRRQRAHGAGTDHQSAATGETTEELLGELERDADDRGTGTIDPRVVVNSLSHAECGLREIVEALTRGGGVLRLSKGGAYLSEDLLLADDHRVEPRRDLEGMLNGAVFVTHVEVRGELAACHPGDLGQRLGHVDDSAVEAADFGIDLDPVAGREHHRLGHVRRPDQVGLQLRDGLIDEGDPLEERHGRGAVAHAHDKQGHRRTPACLRCSWKARICSSVARSTLRTSTPAGTESTAGAKLRMLETPAATKRSHTS